MNSKIQVLLAAVLVVAGCAALAHIHDMKRGLVAQEAKKAPA